MINLSKKLTTMTLLLLSSHISHAAFYNQALSSLQTHQADAKTRGQLIAALESCGVPNDGIDSGCLRQSLQGPNSQIQNPGMAANILNSYTAALNYRVNDPNCQIPDIYVVNQTAAECVLVLHYTVLESSDPGKAKAAFDRCLLGKIGGLALAGNIAAQFSLRSISKESGRGDQLQVWTNALKNNNDPLAVQDMAKCF